MTKIELPVPKFEADGRCINYLADGSDGFVYSIGRGFAAKVPAGPKNWRAMGRYGYGNWSWNSCDFYSTLQQFSKC